MVWTEVTRHRYERSSDGYSSEVTNAEWAVVGLLLPGRNTLGRPCRVKLRHVWDAPVSRGNGMRVVAFAARSSTNLDATLLFLPLARTADGREGPPYNRCCRQRASGSRVAKRHIMTDTCENLLAIRVHAANIRDGASDVFVLLKRDAPDLRHIFAPSRWWLRKSLPG